MYILDYIKKNTKIVSVTEYARSRLYKLKKEDPDKLKKAWGDYEFCQISNLSLPESDKNPTDKLRDGNSPTKEIHEERLSKVLSDIIKTFAVKEKVVLRCRYGLNKGKKKRLDELGDAFTVTKECMRQIERRAIKKLKSRLKKIGIHSMQDIIND
jgi:RNA polymerase sigma factor (sigma-70 family)